MVLVHASFFISCFWYITSDSYSGHFGGLRAEDGQFRAMRCRRAGKSLIQKWWSGTDFKWSLKGYQESSDLLHKHSSLNKWNIWLQESINCHCLAWLRFVVAAKKGENQKVQLVWQKKVLKWEKRHTWVYRLSLTDILWITSQFNWGMYSINFLLVLIIHLFVFL